MKDIGFEEREKKKTENKARYRSLKLSVREKRERQRR